MPIRLTPTPTRCSKLTGNELRSKMKVVAFGREVFCQYAIIMKAGILSHRRCFTLWRLTMTDLQKERAVTRQIVTDALKADELSHSLDNISSDDNCEIEDYTDAELVAEAKWVLSCYSEPGHIHCQMLTGDDGPESQKTARREKRQLQRFLKKHA